ncbi:MAG: N-acetyl-gamma-glutamyl-phosphate reductase [Thermodesulfobacteriota bacterium]
MGKSGEKIRAAIAGATGYTGAELIRILSRHPSVEITHIYSRQHAGVPISKVYPAFTGVVERSCEKMDEEAAGRDADVVFLALPHKLPMGVAPAILGAGAKVVDLSADFRFSDAAVYEAHYEPHLAPELLPRAVYGLTELYRDRVAGADLLGNPGCYPTCSLLALVPFLRKGLVEPDGIVIDAKSGVSGAGRGTSLTTHYCEVTEGFSAYKVASHRHTPEIEQIVSREAGKKVALSFVPHLTPMSRGMLATCYVKATAPMSTEDALAVLADCYQGSPFVKVLPKGILPQTRHVRGTNCAHLSAVAEKSTGRLILVSVIDNLGKGASGQAVQNMNVMFGLPETRGLDATPYPV